MSNYLNQDLTGTNFDGQDLNHALFRGANLTDCSFVGANLSGANMRETTIQGCDFTDAVMYYSNIKDAQGTADFSGALVFGMPKWIPMPGSIYSDPEVESRQLQIDELVSQSGLGFSEFNITDQNTMNYYIDYSYSDQPEQELSLSGTYDAMPNGRDVYVSIGHLEVESIETSWVITEHMKQGTTFDTTQGLFLANPEYVEA